jgi:hypothetical protein
MLNHLQPEKAGKEQGEGNQHRDSGKAKTETEAIKIAVLVVKPVMVMAAPHAQSVGKSVAAGLDGAVGIALDRLVLR